MAIIDHDAALARAGANITGWWSQTFFLARRYPLGAVGAIIVALFIFTAAFADVIAPTDPTATNSKFSLAAPGGLFWLGADFMGRDMYSRVVHGARISLAVGAGAMGLGGVIGISVGLASGYLGGWFDLILQRLLDVMQALPLLVMAIVMAAALGPSLRNTIIAIAIPLVPTVARVVRSSTLSLREQPFVEAARAVDRAGNGADRLGDPGRGVSVVPRARYSRAAPVVGPHAVGVGRGIRPHRALAGDLPRRRDQPHRVRHQPAGRRAARHPRSAAADVRRRS
jgi:hypothetical protein